MHVAYRGLAAVLSLLLTAVALEAQTTPNTVPAAEQQHEAAKPSVETQPCRPGEDKRQSDLCAQWKAADAASASADWAFWTMLAGAVGLLVGLGTLIAAWRAAHWAKAAAMHTEAGAAQSARSAKAAEDALEQSRLASRTDLRAWVSVEAKLLEYKRTKDFAHFTVEIALSNIGKTPAFDVGVSYNISAKITSVVSYGTVPKLEKFPHQLTPIMPNDAVTQRFGIRIANDEIERAIAIAAKEGFAVMAVIDIIAYYRTVFDDVGCRERTTSVRYSVHPDIDPQMEVAWRQIGQEWLQDSSRDRNSLKFAQDKSAPAHLS